MFELCTRENRIIKIYEERSLFFIAARCKSNPDFWIAPDSVQGVSCMEKLREKGLNILKLRKYVFHSFEEISYTLKHLQTTDEGYVIWDYTTNTRIKMKNPSYVAFNALRFYGLSPKRICILLIDNTADEYLSYFPDDKCKFEPYRIAFEEFRKDILSTYELYKDIEDQKSFASHIKGLPIASLLFSLRRGVPFADILAKMPLDSVVSMIESYTFPFGEAE
jgi:hypothetical protein